MKLTLTYRIMMIFFNSRRIRTSLCAFCLLLSHFFVDAQALVRGTVVSEGEAVPGATVVVEGTSNGTVTDVDGVFSISANPDDFLLVSFVGFKTQRIQVGAQTNLDISLEIDFKSLDEVIVVGYGTVKKSDLTGAVTTVKPEELNQGAILSVDQAMQGRIPGVRISQASAEPGGGLNIRIRGAGSITGGNQPLYVIDGLPINNANMLSGGGAAGIPGNGVPRNPLNTINPNDIASIEVLKDASATAIYGSRGANGVILITTKKGKDGKLNVNFDMTQGVATVYDNLDNLSTSEYIQAMNDLAADREEPEVFSAEDIAAIGDGTNWYDLVTQDARVSNYNLSFSGGLNDSRYFVSANYANQEGVVKNTSSERYSFRVNLDHSFSEKLKYSMNLTSSFVVDENSTDGSNNTDNGPYSMAVIYDPTIQPFNEDGTFTQSPFFTFPSPIALLERQSTTETNRTLGSMDLSYELIEGLSLRGKVGVDRRVGRQDLFSPRTTFAGGSPAGAADISSLERDSYLLQFTANYDTEINPVFGLNALLGTTFEQFNSRSFGVGISEFPTDLLGTDNIGLGNIERATLGSNKQDNSILSYLSRVNATIYEDLLVTLSFRVDGSSRFGENNKFAGFPSAAVAYKLEGQTFIPDFFNQLKVRTSWGRTGNQEIGNYASLATFRTGGNAVLNGSPFQGVRASRLPNPDLKWETTTQFDVGLDFGILNDRVFGSIDYFIRDTDDMLIDFPLPSSSSFNSILRNAGSMRNTGIEIGLTTNNIDAGDFEWNTTLQFASIRNEVTSIGGLEEILTGNFFTTTFSIIRPGEELNAYYTLNQIGIFGSQEEVDNSAQPSSSPGNPIYEDVNGDGVIDDGDRKVVGSPWPDFTYGITNEFRYKNWGLNIFMDGQQGADLMNGNMVYSLHPPTVNQNRLRDQIIDRWTPENPDAEWPSAIDPSSYGPFKIDSKNIEDASFFRIQSIQFSYEFNFNNSVFSSLRLSATGQNLLIVTNYSGLNPEANRNQNATINNNRNTTSNVWAERNAYPLSRTYLLGVNLQF